MVLAENPIQIMLKFSQFKVFQFHGFPTFKAWKFTPYNVVEPRLKVCTYNSIAWAA